MITLGRHSYHGDVQELFDPQVTVGNFTSIASQVILFGGCEHPSVMNKQAVSNFPFADRDWGDYTRCGSRGPITIGNDVWIGERAIILDGITIGDGAIIGAGTVVTHDITAYGVCAGNPVIHKRFRFTHDQVVSLLKIKWWLWDDAQIKESLTLMKDVDAFIQKYANG